MPVARTTKPPMIPLDTSRSVKHRNLRTGRMEVWAAISRDGCWYFEREESDGTPWLIWRRDPATGQLLGEGPTGGPWSVASSLARARRYVAGAVKTEAAA